MFFDQKRVLLWLCTDGGVEWMTTFSWKECWLWLTVGSLVVLGSVRLLFLYSKWRLSPLRQVPGPKHHSFLWGAFLEMHREPFCEPHKRWCQELGAYDKNLPYLGYSLLLGSETLLILDRNLIRTILATQLTTKDPKTHRFHKGPQLGIIRSRLGDGLLSLEGEDWRRHRRILQPSFHTTFLKERLNEVVPVATNQFIAQWKLALNKQNSSRQTTSSSPREIDAKSHLSALTLEIVGKVLFSHEFHAVQAVREWAEASKAYYSSSSSSSNRNNNNNPKEDGVVDGAAAEIATLEDPFLRSLRETLKPSLLSVALGIVRLDGWDRLLNPTLRKTRQTLNDTADQVIAHALELRNQNSQSSSSSSGNNTGGGMHAKSLLHLMLEAEDPESKNKSESMLPPAIEKPQKEDGRRLSRTELRDEVKIFLMAGHDTTSTWLYWAFYVLAKNPDVQERLYQDIIQHVSDDDDDSATIGLEQTARMEYLQAFLQEVLRLYPPAGVLFRYNTLDEKLNGHTIPVGTRLEIRVHMLHRHPRYWDDPEAFRPERWMNVSDAERERRRFAFLPFSAGARNCIGQRFATLEVQLALAPIVRAFKIFLAPSQRDTKHTFTALLGTMKAKPGLRIVVQERPHPPRA